MKFAAVALVILSAVALAAAFILRSPRDSGRSAGGFRDWVKNPDYKRSVGEYFAARDALTVPDDISAADIRKMVDQLFIEKDDDFNFDRLKLVGEKALPQLIAALSKDRTYTTTFVGRDDFINGSPFERICDLLEPLGPPQAVAPLLRFASHPNEYFRQTAAIALGSIGSKDCIEPVTSLLRDDDDNVRSYALIGIDRGIKANRSDPQFLNSLFPLLAEPVAYEDRVASGTAPYLMVAIDRDRAISAILSDTYLTTDNYELAHALQALNRVHVAVPHTKLLPLLSELEPIADSYPHDSAYAAALIAYALHPDANAERVFRESVESSNDKVCEAAAEALGILHGITNPYYVVFTTLEEAGLANLSEPQRHYYAVYIYDAEVNNGGHSQYFVNSSGDHYKSALAGLSAIRATERARILSTVLALFGNGGPSTDNDQRHQQLASFSSSQDEQLIKLDSQYHKCNENVSVLLSMYAIENKDHFSGRE